ncbi:hypothetical protein H4582DRAFT_2054270 [Lactarius indigo]|nr:hypothetical protein H4582DRAFT_2054270 [Lactarius indigo]
MANDSTFCLSTILFVGLPISTFDRIDDEIDEMVPQRDHHQPVTSIEYCEQFNIPSTAEGDIHGNAVECAAQTWKGASICARVIQIVTRHRGTEKTGKFWGNRSVEKVSWKASGRISIEWISKSQGVRNAVLYGGIEWNRGKVRGMKCEGRVFARPSPSTAENNAVRELL